MTIPGIIKMVSTPGVDQGHLILKIVAHYDRYLSKAVNALREDQTTLLELASALHSHLPEHRACELEKIIQEIVDVNNEHL